MLLLPPPPNVVWSRRRRKEILLLPPPPLNRAGFCRTRNNSVLPPPPPTESRRLFEIPELGTGPVSYAIQADRTNKFSEHFARRVGWWQHWTDLLPTPTNCKPDRPYKQLHREQQTAIIFRLRTHHAQLNAHLHRIKKEHPTKCVYCPDMRPLNISY